MSAKIPQDVTREDRLIGPLTLKQFLYILGGAAVVFIAFQYYSQNFLYPLEFWGITSIASTLALALAFARINGLPFATFMGHAFAFLFSPKNRRWEKDGEESLTVSDAENAALPKTEATTATSKSTNVGQLELLAKVLDTGGRMDENNANANRISNVSADTTTVEEPIVEDVLEDTDR